VLDPYQSTPPAIMTQAGLIIGLDALYLNPAFVPAAPIASTDPAPLADARTTGSVKPQEDTPTVQYAGKLSRFGS
jgi:hypothetical protein